MCTKSRRDVESFDTSCWDTREIESTVHVVLIDSSVHGALGSDGGEGDGHGLEGRETTREDMSEDRQEVRYRTYGGHRDVAFIHSDTRMAAI